MQIRVANRQDEPIIREIVAQTKAERGLGELSLTGSDADLNNVEANYFWFDGIVVVAEEDGQILGFSAARRGQDEQTLELTRLVVIPLRRSQGIAHQLLDTILFFGMNSEYTEIVFNPETHALQKQQPFYGFSKDPARAGRWHRVLSDNRLNSCSTVQ